MKDIVEKLQANPEMNSALEEEAALEIVRLRSALLAEVTDLRQKMDDTIKEIEQIKARLLTRRRQET